MTNKLKVTRKRNFSAHHMLIGAARAALEDANQRRPGWFYSELTAITLSALSIEAMCNAIGNRIIDGWKDFESASPLAKLRLLCERLNISYDKSKEPWASAIWLCHFRNLIAHAKPEIIAEEYVWTRDEYDSRRKDEPKSKLERLITLGNAAKALRTAESIKTSLCEKISPEDRSGLYSDAWEGSARGICDD
jgi:hypothetical protein